MDTNGHITLCEDYVPFELSKLLKEKGFDSEDCFAFYNEYGEIGFLQTFGDIADYDSETCVIAPTLQMACKFLREVHNLYVSPKHHLFCGSKKNDKPYYKWEDRVLKLPSNNQIHPQIYEIHEYYETYEQAVESALKYTLENLI